MRIVKVYDWVWESAGGLYHWLCGSMVGTVRVPPSLPSGSLLRHSSPSNTSSVYSRQYWPCSVWTSNRSRTSCSSSCAWIEMNGSSPAPWNGRRLGAIERHSARHDAHPRHEHCNPDDTRRDALVPALAIPALQETVHRKRGRLVPSGCAFEELRLVTHRIHPSLLSGPGGHARRTCARSMRGCPASGPPPPRSTQGGRSARRPPVGGR